MPPALSEMGPNTSIVRTYAAVDSMPIVATAVPKRPSAFDSVRPARACTQLAKAPTETFMGLASAATLQHALHRLQCPQWSSYTLPCTRFLLYSEDPVLRHVLVELSALRNVGMYWTGGKKEDHTSFTSYAMINKCQSLKLNPDKK